MGLLYCRGWLGPCGAFGLSEGRAPSGLVLAPGLPRGGPGSEASPWEEKAEVWEKEALKVCLTSVPGPASTSGLVSRAGSWHRVAAMQGREKRAVRGHTHPVLLRGPETEG